MRSTLNKAAVFALALVLAAGFAGRAQAAESPALLHIVTNPGVLLVDDDTVDIAGKHEVDVEIDAGEHVLRYFPYQTTAQEWVHRYLIYPFSVGSDGRRSIDLTRCEIYTFRSTPQAAELRYRDRYLGRTPGEFLLLSGQGDSVLVKMPGFETEAFDLDQIDASGQLDVFVNLDPKIPGTEVEEEEIMAYQYHSPVKKLLAPDLMISLISGVAMLAVGAHFNQDADKHYERYQKLLGPRAREKAYSEMKRSDRLSKASFMVGDTALGIFGYMLVRRIIFPAHDDKEPDGSNSGRGLTMSVTTSRAQLSYRF